MRHSPDADGLLELVSMAVRPWGRASDNRAAGGERFLASASAMFRVEVLTGDEWFRLRDIRLSALKEHPQAFLSSFALQATYNEGQWRAEFSRGEWTVVVANDRTVGLIG